MSVHPKNIARRYAHHRYVFVHRDATLRQRMGQVRFVDGVSSPMTPAQACTIAAVMGAKIRFGYCLDAPIVFGEYSDEDVAKIGAKKATSARDALRADLEELSTLAKQLHGNEYSYDVEDGLTTWDGIEDEGERAIIAQSVKDSLLEVRAALELASQAKTAVGVLEERVVGVTPPGADTPEVRSWMESEATKQGFESLRWEEVARDAHGHPYARLYGRRQVVAVDAGEPVVFVDEQPPGLSPKDPLRLTRKELRVYNKAPLAQLAQDLLQVTLDQSKTKEQMIDDLFKDSRVLEVPEASEEDEEE